MGFNISSFMGKLAAIKSYLENKKDLKSQSNLSPKAIRKTRTTTTKKNPKLVEGKKP